MRSSVEGVHTSEKRFTGAVTASRCVSEGLEHYELVAAIGEDNHNYEGRFTML